MEVTKCPKPTALPRIHWKLVGERLGKGRAAKIKGS